MICSRGGEERQAITLPDLEHIDATPVVKTETRIYFDKQQMIRGIHTDSNS